MAWKHMDEWAAPTGPKNGTEILILKSDGERLVARFDGMGLSWQDNSGRSFPREDAVAWDYIPDVPEELTTRIAAVKKARAAADDLYRSPLDIKTVAKKAS